MEQELELLPSPLDAVMDALGGPNAVAEMTGRRGRLIRKNGRLTYDLRPEGEEMRWAPRQPRQPRQPVSMNLGANLALPSQA